jgi:xanthine dehydrogenase YagS FAD-binding subunit
MNDFTYTHPTNPTEAIAALLSQPGTEYLGGGTNLIDHLKLGVITPSRLVDVRHLGLDKIHSDGHSVTIGAGVTNSAAAYHHEIQTHFPVLSEAILAGASPQLRNAATTAGNLLQKTRCTYFRDIQSPCNKRIPGSGCSAIEGFNRSHAILGTSSSCIATHPSDMAVALTALEAVVHVQDSTGVRKIPIDAFYVSYGEDPAKENVLKRGDLVVAVEIPRAAWLSHSKYIKARDRSSYEFALASAAVAMNLEDGKVKNCRIALGGVATKPWRAHAAETALVGQTAGPDAIRVAAEAELTAAKAQKDNGFKIELCKRVIVKALQEAAVAKGA